MITVRAWGIATAVVDEGRPGWAAYGASRGGAADLVSLALGNRLVGNVAGAAALETSGGLRLVLAEPAIVAITGALADINVTDGPAMGWGSGAALPAGAELGIGRLRDGARVYVAVRGGVSRHGDSLTVGADPGSAFVGASAPRPERHTHLAVWPGPRLDWFAADAWHALLQTPFTVHADSDRVGVRLRGAALSRIVTDELPSEGLVEGAIQVPPDGQPIIMLADHPTTGGYPVIGVLDPGDIAHAAQLAPGDTISFRAPPRRAKPPT